MIFQIYNLVITNQTLTIIYLFGTFVNCHTALYIFQKNRIFVYINETPSLISGVSSRCFILFAQILSINLDILMGSPQFR